MNTSQLVPENSVLRRVSWLTIVLTLLAIGTFLIISRQDFRSRYPIMTQGVSVYEGSSGKAPMFVADAPKMGVSNYYPNQNPEVPATDTREFLKVSYGASMRTRDVQSTTRRVVTTVRGYAGRIDQESSSSDYGYVSFVLPQSKYDAFRTELESLVGSRFLSVNISSQNLLSQKVSIEEQQKQADTALADHAAARQKLVSTHTAIVRSLQSRIDADTRLLSVLRGQEQTSDVAIQLQVTSDQLDMLKQQLSNENASYAIQLRSADEAIKYATERQKAVQTQDQALLDSVATVTGRVSVQWISLWDVTRLYLPGYWIPTIFAALAFVSYLWDRRRWMLAGN